MGRTRSIQKINSVFDIPYNNETHSKSKCSIRVMFEYDELNMINEFTVLDRNLPGETTERIISWLEKNIRLEDIQYKIESNGYYAAAIL